VTASAQPPEGSDNGRGKSGGFLAFWTTLPGILTGVAALITAIVGLATLVQSWKGSSQNASQKPTAVTAASSSEAANATSSDSGTSGQAATGGTENGPLVLRRGDAADLEQGLIGFNANSDVMFGPETTPYLHAAGTAFLAPIQTSPNKSICSRALSGHRDTSEAIPNLSAPWVCVSTSEGHVGYVKIVRTPGVGSSELDLKYAIWF
jgi:hypothetical protein